MSERPDGHLGDLLHGLIALLLRCLNAERAVVLALDDDGRLQPVYPPNAPPEVVARALARSGRLLRSVGGEPAVAGGVTAALGTGPLGRLATHAVSAVQEIIASTAELAGQQSASALCLPIRVGETTVGLLYLESGRTGSTFAPELVARLVNETALVHEGARTSQATSARFSVPGRQGPGVEDKAKPATLASPVIEPLAELERAAILQALQIHGGNRTAAARALGISVRKLQYRIKEYARQGISITSP